jgi:hypothetical protein
MQFLVPTLGIKMIENDFPYIPTHIGDPKPVAPPLAKMIDRSDERKAIAPRSTR